MTIFRRPSHAAAAGDPIPFAHDGATHLFYLSSPPGTQDYPDRVRTSWQHVVSTDLVRWDERPTAVEPGTPGDVDAGGIWTGSVVEHDGVFHLFYTGHDPSSATPQTICVATSTDLETFTRSGENPVLAPVAGCEDVDWRDPYVFWNADEGRWWMLIAARRAVGPRWRRGVIMLATSEDLLRWTVEDEPFYDPGTTYCPECPEMWELGGRWYLVYSRFSEDVGTVYRVADSPRGPFRTPTDDALGGRRWYAAKSAPTEDGRVFFGWVHDRVGEGPRQRWLWGGDFAAPRIVTAAQDGSLVSRPADVYATSADPLGELDQDLGAPARRRTQVLADDLPRRVVLDLAFTLGDTAVVGLDLLDDDDRGFGVRLSSRTGRVELTQEPRPLDDFWADLTGRLSDYREVDGAVLDHARLSRVGPQVAARAVLDGELLEVYVDDAVALTWRVPRAAPLRAEVFAEDGVAHVRARAAQIVD